VQVLPEAAALVHAAVVPWELPKWRQQAEAVLVHAAVVPWEAPRWRRQRKVSIRWLYDS
jgi:hypothetical protein